MSISMMIHDIASVESHEIHVGGSGNDRSVLRLTEKDGGTLTIFFPPGRAEAVARAINAAIAPFFAEASEGRPSEALAKAGEIA